MYSTIQILPLKESKRDWVLPDWSDIHPLSLRSWLNCFCSCKGFGGEAAILAALLKEASAEGRGNFFSS